MAGALQAASRYVDERSVRRQGHDQGALGVSISLPHEDVALIAHSAGEPPVRSSRRTTSCSTSYLG